MKKKHFFLLLFVFLVVVACESDKHTEIADATQEKEATPITISAASSLMEAMQEIKEVYETNHDVELVFNFGGSGKLAQQIEQGAPVDVFLSASARWMNTLEEKNQIDLSTRQTITGNKLVLIGNVDTNIQIDSLKEIKELPIEKVAIGNPESVPAGQYTKEALESINIWTGLQNKFVLAKDVRQVLTYIETGNIEVGFVYKTDAYASNDVTILKEVESSYHEAILYPGAIVSRSRHKEEAEAFLHFLLSSSGQAILNKHGFFNKSAGD